MKKKILYFGEVILQEHSRMTLFELLYKKFKQENYELICISFKEKKINNISSQILFDNMKLKHVGNNYLFKFFEIFSIINKIKPEKIIIGGYGYIDCWFILFISLLFKIETILWAGPSETTSRTQKYFFIKFLKKMFIKNINKVIAYGSKSKNYLSQFDKKNKNKFSNSINVSDTIYYKDYLKRYFQNKNNNFEQKHKITIIVAGKFNYRKGTDLVLQVLQKLDKNTYTCFFVGSGPMTKDIDSLIDNGLLSGKNFNFCTPDILANLMCKSDIYLSLSRRDPFSRILSEALCCGCFCLNSINDDATFDLIKEGFNGYYVYPDDLNKTIEIIKKSLTKKFDPQLKINISNKFENSILDYANDIIGTTLK